MYRGSSSGAETFGLRISRLVRNVEEKKHAMHEGQGGEGSPNVEGSLVDCVVGLRGVAGFRGVVRRGRRLSWFRRARDLKMSRGRKVHAGQDRKGSQNVQGSLSVVDRVVGVAGCRGAGR